MVRYPEGIAFIDPAPTAGTGSDHAPLSAASRLAAALVGGIGASQSKIETSAGYYARRAQNSEPCYAS